MATGAGKKQSRAEKDRARLYRARQEFHEATIGRRRRDNVVAGVAGGALILAVVGGQIAYYTLGPGTPAPSPSPTATTPSPAATDATPTPTESGSPTPTPTP